MSDDWEKYSICSCEVVVLECRYETIIRSIIMWVLNLFGWLLVLSGGAGIVFEFFFDNKYQSVDIHGFEYLVAGVVVIAIDKILLKLDKIKELLEKQSGKD